MPKSILIATHGGPSAAGALRMGAHLQKTRGYEVKVLAVVQPIPRYGVGHLGSYPEAYRTYEMAQQEEMKARVEKQVRDLGEPAAGWPVSVEIGTRAPTIVQYARQQNSELIVLGSGEHAPLDRWLGDETPLKVSRLATIPVLTVPRHWDGMQSRVLIPTDFSEHSLRAAHAVVDLLGPRCHLILAHVMWPSEEASDFPTLGEWRETYRQGAEARLREIGGHLRGSGEHSVESIVGSGDPAEEILAFAMRFNVDLIVAGSHGHGFMGRLVMGSVSTHLMRAAPCALLIVPPSSPPRDLRSSETIGHEAERQVEAMVPSGFV
jgi:nucleotide-binding universal stress UspA family protein